VVLQTGRPVAASRATTLSDVVTYIMPSTTIGVEPLFLVWYSHFTAIDLTFEELI
jgi:hypothetical protein